MFSSPLDSKVFLLGCLILISSWGSDTAAQINWISLKMTVFRGGSKRERKSCYLFFSSCDCLRFLLKTLWFLGCFSYCQFSRTLKMGLTFFWLKVLWALCQFMNSSSVSVKLKSVSKPSGEIWPQKVWRKTLIDVAKTWRIAAEGSPAWVMRDAPNLYTFVCVWTVLADAHWALTKQMSPVSNFWNMLR